MPPDGDYIPRKFSFWPVALRSNSWPINYLLWYHNWICFCCSVASLLTGWNCPCLKKCQNKSVSRRTKCEKRCLKKCWKDHCDSKVCLLKKRSSSFSLKNLFFLLEFNFKDCICKDACNGNIVLLHFKIIKVNILNDFWIIKDFGIIKMFWLIHVNNSITS